ncbi:hypothetical protein KCP69_10145 [Salmonella enterica subsp. enterica]|nr:hypothetical protein KCP69_10145 [Salmonella enterica subsp. enterica]
MDIRRGFGFSALVTVAVSAGLRLTRSYTSCKGMKPLFYGGEGSELIHDAAYLRSSRLRVAGGFGWKTHTLRGLSNPSSAGIHQRRQTTAKQRQPVEFAFIDNCLAFAARCSIVLRLRHACPAHRPPLNWRRFGLGLL